MNVIVQDPVNPALLYAGSDHGTYISLNEGNEWHLINNGLPNVANYDMVVHPRENELVIATHGRSIYIMDIKPLQSLKEDKKDNPIVAFEPTPIRYNTKWGQQEFAYIPVKNPVVDILYYVGKAGHKPITVEIMDGNGKVIRKLSGESSIGFHSVKWNLKTEAAKDLKQKKSATLPVDYAKAGTYKVKMTNGTATS